MIIFNSENSFSLENPEVIKQWVSNIIEQEGYQINEINYVFCDDDYLHKLNVDFLDHDTLTDVIGFDYSVGKKLQGDIFISTERVKENANSFQVSFSKELHRVLAHGILHFLGYNDKTEAGKEVMKQKEDEALSLLDYKYG